MVSMELGLTHNVALGEAEGLFMTLLQSPFSVTSGTLSWLKQSQGRPDSEQAETPPSDDRRSVKESAAVC